MHGLLSTSVRPSVKRVYCDKTIKGKELNLMKDQAIHSFNIWNNLGKPRSGKEFDAMRFDKLKYKALIKSKEAASNNQLCVRLYHSLY